MHIYDALQELGLSAPKAWRTQDAVLVIDVDAFVASCGCVVCSKSISYEDARAIGEAIVVYKDEHSKNDDSLMCEYVCEYVENFARWPIREPLIRIYYKNKD